MATQPIQKQNNEPAVPMPKDATWQILAKEAAEEKDPEKLMQIIKALTDALDKKEKKSA
jgi:type II secretory pathway component PulC